MLSSESSAEPGRWSTDRVPYMRAVMDAVSDPMIERVVVPKASQVAYTETINNVLGYFIDQDPSPILVIQPTLEMAEAWSKDRLSPMLRDTPALAGRVRDPKSRDSGNTLRQKVFTGGRMTIVGANSPSGLSARPIRIVLGDEIDRWPLSAGGSSDPGKKRGEGDPLSLAAKRQITFWNRKTLLGSTPVHRLTSVIWREYLLSDRRKYHVPCPQCDHPQTLRWENVRWDKRGEDEMADQVFGRHKPETAHYVCEECGAIWGDVDRHEAVVEADRRAQAGEKGVGWVAENPGGNTAGFHVPGFLSPWLSLEDIIREFLKARNDPQLLQVWTNTVLGEPFEEQSERMEAATLSTRGEAYTPQTLPEAVVLVTAGVDVQVNRLEVQVVGYGRGEETWAIAYEVIHGDPASPEVWKELDGLLLSSLHTDSGRELRIRSCCIDVGDTPHALGAMTFAKSRRMRRIWPTKGQSGPRVIFPKRASRTKTGAIIYLIGVDTAKDAIYGRLRITKPGPGYIHFPAGEGFDDDYFVQLTSEQVITRKREGRSYRVWVLKPNTRNEGLDTMVLALAARSSIPLRLDASPPASIPPPAPHEVDDISEEAVDLGFDRAPPAPEGEREPPVAQRGSGVQHSGAARLARQGPRGGWMGGRTGGWWDR